MTWWNGELVRDMSVERAKEIRKDVVKWANNYGKITGNPERGREAKEFVKTFDEARGQS